MNITLLMADQCSSTSVAAALEFFETANVLQHYAQDKQARQQAGATPLFRLHTASMDGEPVSCTGGLRLTPDRAIARPDGRPQRGSAPAGGTGKLPVQDGRTIGAHRREITRLFDDRPGRRL